MTSPDKEARLAAALRENLRRRKQAVVPAKAGTSEEKAMPDEKA